ncbi:hypothetical protein EV360DRAFT_72125 [Lentinula raphanica]|nr:hypothetical protein EV360DRAFT_72125 [Lentinula raphanica]
MENEQVASEAACAIDELPVEILTKVFCCYCEEDADSHTEDTAFHVQLNKDGLQFRLESIIRAYGKWRQIIFANPIFWSSFSINLDWLTTVTQYKYLLQAISLSEKAEELRLNIVFHGGTTNFSAELNTLARRRVAVLAGLLEQANRWRDVRIQLSSSVFRLVCDELRRDGTKPLRGYFPNLKRLDCLDQVMRGVGSPYTFPPSNDLQEFCDIFKPCPALSHLCVFNDEHGSPFRYSLLTSLTLATFSGRSLTTLLSQCPRLRSLTLGAGWVLRTYLDADSTWSRDNPFYHPNLTTLSLPDYTSIRFTGAIWADIRFPSLDTLYVEGNMDEIPELTEMLIRSRCRLKTMILGGMPPEVFQKLLWVAPSLKSLTLDLWHFAYMCPENIDQFLAPLFRSGLYIPVSGLSFLKIEMCPDHVPLDGIVEKVQSGVIPPYPYPHYTFEDSDRYAYSEETDQNKVAAVYAIVNRLRLMILSRRKGQPWVRFKTKPSVAEPLPSNRIDPNDALTQLPEYLLAVGKKGTGMDLDGLVTLELQWNG